MFLKVTRSYGREFFLHFTEEKVLVVREKIESLSFTYTANGKRQIQLLKIENEQIKTAQNNSY